MLLISKLLGYPMIYFEISTNYYYFFYLRAICGSKLINFNISDIIISIFSSNALDLDEDFIIFSFKLD